MKEFLKHRVAGLMRTRVLLSILGLFIIYNKPNVAQWVVAILGMAMGVSAVDAWKGTSNGGKGQASGDINRNQEYSDKVSGIRVNHTASERTSQQDQ